MSKISVFVAAIFIFAVLALPTASAAGLCGEKNCGFWAGDCSSCQRCVSGWINTCVTDATCFPCTAPICSISDGGSCAFIGKCSGGKCVLPTPTPTKTSTPAPTPIPTTPTALTPTPTPVTSCTDTDNGNDRYAKGTCTPATGKTCDDTGSSSCADYCPNENSVRDYHCGSSGGCIYNDLSCPSGCSDGACRTAPTPTSTPTPVPATTCTTPTTTNIFKKETCADITGAHPDACVVEGATEGTINQFYCDAGQCKKITGSCSAGYKCQSGACVPTVPKPTSSPVSTATPSCSETDGQFDYLTKGTCTDAGPSAICPSGFTVCEDKCATGSEGVAGGTLNEYYCYAKRCYLKSQSCTSTQKCADGKCVPIASASPTPTKTLTPTPTSGSSECQAKGVRGYTACAKVGKVCVSSSCSKGCSDFPGAGGSCVCTAQCVVQSPLPISATGSVCQPTGVTGNVACASVGRTCVSGTCDKGGISGCADFPLADGTCGCTAQCTTATPTPTSTGGTLTPTPTPSTPTATLTPTPDSTTTPTATPPKTATPSPSPTETPTAAPTATPATTACTDGTPKNQCSATKPKYCNVALKRMDYPRKCGCPEGQELSWFGLGNICVASPVKKTQCDEDGTKVGECSTTKPKWCNAAGKLTDSPKTCRCPDGQTLNIYLNKCVATASSAKTPTPKCNKNTKCETGLGGESYLTCPEDCPLVKATVVTAKKCEDGTPLFSCSTATPGQYCNGLAKLVPFARC